MSRSSRLETYRDKRDFDRTPEPSGDEEVQTDGDLFVVQKHAASRLHYDFRLELDGVLLSWAVPKGPSLDPGERRLAVHVEDHPLAYGGFEGVIPEDEYGGGTVMLWDRGRWRPLGDAREDYRRGKLKFRLEGEKLAGGWMLVRMTGERSEGGKNWLLIKERDEAASAEVDVTEERPRSVSSGRDMEEIAADRDLVWEGGQAVPQEGRERRAKPKRRAAKRSGKNEGTFVPDLASLEGARKGRAPEDFAPQLATLARQVPEGDGWLHEIKYDGYRFVCHVGGGKARLVTRNGKDWTRKFPAVARAAAELPVERALLDGELVALAPDGTTSFQLLQQALKEGGGDLAFYLFDLPYLGGYDLRRVALVERKRLLRELLENAGPPAPLRYSDHIRGQGRQVLENACRMALEGIISKRASSPYESRRARSWRKLKCVRRQEFVVGGATAPRGSRSGFGALLLGYHDDEGRLVYAGKVGTGFDGETLADLDRRLRRLERSETPFDEPPARSEARGARWVEPELIVEVEFSEWTDDDRLRHPVYLGLRADKKPEDVRRETPALAPARRGAGAGGANVGRGKTSRGPNAFETVAGVRLTHPGRVLYPDQELTKLELARYYVEIAEHVLPHVAGRPLSLVRCPQGREGHCFYQKHLTESLPEALGGVEIEESDGVSTYIVVHDLAGLVSLVQIGALELHPWGSREDRLERPDRLVFDLDPSPEVGWKEVALAALEVRKRLTELGLVSFLRTSGGKGLHVVAPVARRTSWDDFKAFARAVAEDFARREPKRYVATASKAKRRGRIFLDYLRNGRGATAIASYSPRARAGAPVATPIAWEELPELPGADVWNVTNVPERLAERGDPWEGFFDLRQSITAAMRRELGMG